jgi:spoIIIJ-associated protein
MDVALDQQGEVAEDFLAGLVEAFGLRADISIAQLDDETIELSLEGADLNVLIGARGATLQAIQDLARTVVQRQTGASHGRILVDVLGYRKKRRAALERFARQIAEEVQASGARRVLEPMGAADRKVVHDVINTIEGVQTTSEGEEPRRRVVILPGSAAGPSAPAASRDEAESPAAD